MLRSTFAFAATLLLVLVSCKKSDPSNLPSPADLSSARLLDFVLNETAYATIQVSHPTVVNGVEIAEGAIQVTVPAATQSLQLSPKTSNFTNNAFNITPQLGVVQDFSAGAVVYTISSKADGNKKVHYRVTIVRAQQPAALEITSFKFEGSKNPQLGTDVLASQIKENPGSLGKIYIFVPQGTDFSSLRPTVGFTGGNIFYSQDPLATPANYTLPYPDAGIAIDFAYPKRFFLVVKNNNSMKTYEVIADLVRPFKLDHSTVTLPEVSFGTNVTSTITRLVNIGNHPFSLKGISHMAQQANAPNAIRAFTAFPSGGLEPGSSVPVTVTINAATNAPGSYNVTAGFVAGLLGDDDPSPFFYPAQIDISAVISN